MQDSPSSDVSKFGNNLVIAYDVSSQSWRLYQNPTRIITTYNKDQVQSSLKEIENLVENYGYHAAGFVSYEAGSAFDSALMTKQANGFPLLWFGLYKQVKPFSLPAKAPAKDQDMHWSRSDSRECYFDAVSKVKQYIVEGDIYQVNYSYRMNSNDIPNAWHAFLRMIRAQGAGYGAYVQTEQWTIASASPELFFTLNGDLVESRPMKGTATRGISFRQDQAQKNWLHNSVKNRAENLMIVDMVRNDIGKIANIGSVTVPSLFSVEQYPTVLQMTSLVQGQSQRSFCDLFAALFPAASITGAPKARSMQIIDELESKPRKVYTGTVGFYEPGRKAQFNVAIRTLIVNNATGEAEYSVGAGITTDSQQQEEYDECSTKALVLNYEVPNFDLLETLVWHSDSGFYLLAEHLLRLRNSATYLYRPIDVTAIKTELERLAKTFKNQVQQIRLLLKPEGALELQSSPLVELPIPYRVSLGQGPIDLKDWTFYHKTSLRGNYQRAREQVSTEDVILWNDKGQVTESSIANIVVQLNGTLITPPVECGLLDGVYRQQLLKQGVVKEGIIICSDLPDCKAIYLANSVRKMWQVSLVEDTLR